MNRHDIRRRVLSAKGVTVLSVLLATSAGVPAVLLLRRPSGPVTRIDLTDGNDAVAITDWRVSGPWRLDAGKAKAPFTATRDFEQDLADREQDLEAAMRRDQIAGIGISERKLRLPEKAAPGPETVLAEFRNGPIQSPTDAVYWGRVFGDLENFGVVYMSAEIETPRPADTVWLMGVSNLARVWIDGRLVLSAQVGEVWRTGPFKYLKRMILPAGSHRIFAKVISNPTVFGKHWNHFELTMATPAAARRLAGSGGGDILLARSIVGAQVGVALHENVRSYCAPGGRRCDAVVDILDSCGQAVQSSTVDLFSTLLVPRPPTQGLYSLRLRIGGAVLEEPLYYGLAASELDVPALKLASEAWPDEETKAVASALTKRLDRLFGPVDLLERSHADWQRRVVWAIGQLESMACSVKTGDQPLREYSGTRLGAFRSAIDGQHQLYLLHLPAPRSGQSGHSGVPLVVNFPYRLYDGGKPVPFYFGMQFARLDDMEYRCKLADEHGFAYLSTQARGEESFAPMAAVDVMEAVADVEKKHVIDRSRVYLFGHCEGGSGSLLLASQYPGTFAAVSAVGAPTSEGSPPDRPIDLAANLNDTPALLIHSRFDAKVPVSELFSFQAAYASAGVNATVKVLERSDNEWTSEDPLRTIFDFFGKTGETQRPKRVRLVTGRLRYGSAHWLEVTRLTDYGHPGTVDAQDAGHGRILITSENVGQLAIKLDSLGYGEGCNTPVEIVLNGQAVSTGVRSGCRVVIEVDGEKAVHGAGTRKSALVEGPIGDLFARPFLVVTGSLGEPGGGGFNGDFVRTWEERYYGKCRQKSDTAITPEDISRYDVVLIGDGRVNSLSRQIEARLPFRMRNDGVEIAQERFKGDGLCMAALYPNPLNPAKYVLYMAGTQSALPHSWDPRWFGESGSDVLLWRSRGDGSIEVIKRLRWNEDWTRPVPVSEKGR